MTLDGFLTFLALIVAVYALIPAVERLRLRLDLIFQLPLAIFAFALVMYLEFFPSLRCPCPDAFGSACRFLVLEAEDAGRAAFIVVLSWMFLAWLVQTLPISGSWSLLTIQRIFAELIDEKRYFEAIFFLREHLPLVSDAIKRRRLGQRLSNWLRLRGPYRTFEERLRRDTLPKPWPGLLGKIANALSSCIPWSVHAEDQAQDILRTATSDTDLVTTLIESKPYVVIDFLEIEFRGRFELADKYLVSLIHRPISILAQELKDGHLVGLDGAFEIPERCRLLKFLFDPISTAEKLYAWKSVGEAVLAKLKRGSNDYYIDALNNYVEDFDDSRWRDPTWIGLSFFEAMVTAGAHYSTFHMWLHYVQYIAERLIEAYDGTHPGAEQEKEFPNSCARLIYDAIDIMGDWVKLIRHLPDGSFHATLPAAFTSTPKTIPAIAAIAVGNCMGRIFEAENLGNGFTSTLYGSVMRDINSFANDGSDRGMRMFFVQSILERGQRGTNSLYGDWLKRQFMRIDIRLRSELADYRDALFAVYP